MKKSVSSLILYLLFSIAVGSARGVGEQDACSSSCGPVSIRYPFRLKGDPAKCGNPGFELVCADNKAILDLHPGKFYATQISYENNTIQVVEDNFANCRLPFNFPSVGFRNLTIPINFPSVGFRNVRIPSPRYFGKFTYFFTEGTTVATFVNCSKKIQEDRRLSYAVPCLSGSDIFVYIVFGSDVGSVPANCSFLFEIPLSRENLREILKSVPSQLLKEQFSLGWGERELTRTEIIQTCLKEGNREVKRYNQEMDIFIWLEYLFDLRNEVLRCMLDEEHQELAPVQYYLVLVCTVSFQILLTLLVISTLVRFIFAPLSIWVFLIYNCCKMIVPFDNIEKFLRSQKDFTTRRYTYTDIIAMTNHFKEKIGQGGFGSVYKGELFGGYLVAVKMLGNSKLNGEEFINEVSTIGRIHHMNVVRLVGFCSEQSKRALIYEFMPNGSLDKYIFSSNGERRHFSVEKLNQMALGVARGIDYLHRGCDMRILHFDIKPHNILLDQNFNPKIADFGLAKLYPKDQSVASISAARGTIGYIAPELVSRSFGIISYKSDVYSFGMLLLEMAGGRRNVNHKAEHSSQVYYPSWIYDRLIQSEGPEICNSIDIDDTERKLCKVGLWCIQMRPLDRPSMSRVIEMLEADVHTLQMPPKPFLSTSASASTIQPYTDSSLSELSIISEDV